MLCRIAIFVLIVGFFGGAGKALAGYASVVIDADTGAVLSEQNAEQRSYPASLTKMMTLYLVFEALERQRLTLKQPIAVSRRAAGQAPSRLGLRPGQTITVEQVILALVTKSANDAATAVAEALGGTEIRFAQMMTERARALGMKFTTFRNASGLPDRRQVTTARDMATLARALWRDFPQYYPYFSRQHFTYRGRVIANHNDLLRSYAGADGIKTGYIRASGYNLAASAARDGRRLIGVILGGKSPSQRNQRMAALFDQGFEQQLIARTSRPTATALAAPPLPAPKPGSGQIDLALAPSPALALAETGQGDAAEEPAELMIEEAWSVQVGAFTRREPAARATLTAMGALPDMLGATQPQVIEVITGNSTIYRARLTGLDEAGAREACRQLRAQQAACLAVRPGGTVEISTEN
ncbi:MAG TPA: D-alanyl-D-alanine carboxypeptidase [Alphaproteobacteria bacterium]|nr:D-alanyl-D-alanine carboxypeptidase [Alphaproteobacteria bacterium]